MFEHLLASSAVKSQWRIRLFSKSLKNFGYPGIPELIYNFFAFSIFFNSPLVKLFSSIIRKDGDDYFLVTPVEKVGIIVDDAPFVAVDFDVENKGLNQIINFHTHVGDEAIASEDNPIRVLRDEGTGEPSPYILIRSNLEALIDRKSFYRLVELGSMQNLEGIDWFGIRSSGIFFPIIPEAELN